MKTQDVAAMIEQRDGVKVSSAILTQLSSLHARGFTLNDYSLNVFGWDEARDGVRILVLDKIILANPINKHKAIIEVARKLLHACVNTNQPPKLLNALHGLIANPETIDLVCADLTTEGLPNPLIIFPPTVVLTIANQVPEIITNKIKIEYKTALELIRHYAHNKHLDVAEELSPLAMMLINTLRKSKELLKVLDQIQRPQEKLVMPLFEALDEIKENLPDNHALLKLNGYDLLLKLKKVLSVQVHCPTHNFSQEVHEVVLLPSYMQKDPLALGHKFRIGHIVDGKWCQSKIHHTTLNGREVYVLESENAVSDNYLISVTHALAARLDFDYVNAAINTPEFVADFCQNEEKSHDDFAKVLFNGMHLRNAHTGFDADSLIAIHLEQFSMLQTGGLNNNPSIAYTIALELHKGGWLSKPRLDNFKLRAEYFELLNLEIDKGGYPLRTRQLENLAQMLDLRINIGNAAYGNKDAKPIYFELGKTKNKETLIVTCIDKSNKPELDAIEVLEQLSCIEAAAIEKYPQDEAIELQRELAPYMRDSLKYLLQDEVTDWRDNKLEEYEEMCKKLLKEHNAEFEQLITNEAQKQVAELEAQLVKLEVYYQEQLHAIAHLGEEQYESRRREIVDNYKKQKRKITKNIVGLIVTIPVLIYVAPAVIGAISAQLTIAAEGLQAKMLAAVVKGSLAYTTTSAVAGNFNAQGLGKAVATSVVGLGLAEGLNATAIGKALDADFVGGFCNGIAFGVVNNEYKHILTKAVLSGGIQYASVEVADTIAPIDPKDAVSVKSLWHYFVLGASSSALHTTSYKLAFNQELDFSDATIAGLNSVLMHMAQTHANTLKEPPKTQTKDTKIKPPPQVEDDVSSVVTDTDSEHALVEPNTDAKESIEQPKLDNSKDSKIRKFGDIKPGIGAYNTSLDFNLGGGSALQPTFAVPAKEFWQARDKATQSKVIAGKGMATKPAPQQQLTKPNSITTHDIVAIPIINQTKPSIPQKIFETVFPAAQAKELPDLSNDKNKSSAKKQNFNNQTQIGLHATQIQPISKEEYERSGEEEKVTEGLPVTQLQNARDDFFAPKYFKQDNNTIKDSIDEFMRDPLGYKGRTQPKIRVATIPQMNIEKNAALKLFIRDIEQQTGMKFTAEEHAAIDKQTLLSKDLNGQTQILVKDGKLKLNNVNIALNTTLSNMQYVVTGNGFWDGILAENELELGLNRVAKAAVSRAASAVKDTTSAARGVGLGLLFHAPTLGDGTLDSWKPMYYVPHELDDGAAYVEKPNIPNKLEYPAQVKDSNDGKHVRPVHVIPNFGKLEGKSLDGAGVDKGPLIRPAELQGPTLLFKGPVRRYECNNGLVYEDAPYHGTKDNAVKSKAPTAPKEGLENSKAINAITTERRIFYDHINNEICVFDNTRGNIYHGHVTSWDNLEQRIKNVLIRHFGFKPNGKPTL